MSDIEFVLSLTPKQVLKVTKLNRKNKFLTFIPVLGTITNKENKKYTLFICNSNKKTIEKVYQRINNKWIKDNEYV
jgi:predicted ATP-grasp superfamily ATP-dependent carboligase